MDLVDKIWLGLLKHSFIATNSDSKTEQLLEWLESNPIIGWVIAIFTVFSITIAAIAKFTGNLDKIINFITEYRPSYHQKRQNLRQQLIEVVLGQVVKRLEKSLHYKLRIDLKRREELQRVGRQNLQAVEQPNPSKPLIGRLFNSFASSESESVEVQQSTAELLNRDDIKGRLLILGEPGGGKTNELLALAKELLQQAIQSNNGLIPVIFELSEWSSDQEKFDNWLIEQLQNKYNIPRKVSKEWIKEEQLFPLLDGLDELRRVNNTTNASIEQIDKGHWAQQIQCVRAINEFLDQYPSISMVICSRRKEYEELQAETEYLKRLKGAIYLQELDDEQIKNYLSDCNRSSLWESLKCQPSLLKLVRSPLFLLMLVVAYQGQTIQNKEQLLDLYIEKQLNDPTNQSLYPPSKAPSPEKTHHYLSWLASKLEAEGVTEFLIERLQPSWLTRNRELYRLLTGVILTLISVFIILLTGYFLGVIEGLVLGVIVWIVLGLDISLFTNLKENVRRQYIKPAENLFFSWKKMLHFGLNIGLLGGLIGGLIFWYWDPFHGVIGGLIAALIWGLIGGVFFGLTTFESDIHDKQMPNQGINKSIKIALNIGLIIGLSIELIMVLIGGLFEGGIGLTIGVKVGLIGGSIGVLIGALIKLFPAIQHLCLRFVLYYSGVAPWNYAKFLEHAENHRFLERIGGRYRFVHDLLRKRFAERYPLGSIDNPMNLL